MEVEANLTPLGAEMSLIEQFCEIDKRLSMRIDALSSQSEPDRTEESIRFFSNQFVEAIDSSLKQQYEIQVRSGTDQNHEQGSEYIDTLINSYFTWKVAQIVYIQKNDCKAIEYLNVIRPNYANPDHGRDLVQLLSLGEFNQFMMFLTNLKFPNVHLNDFVRLFEHTFGKRDNFYKPFNQETEEYKQKQAFHTVFELQKKDFRDLKVKYLKCSEWANTLPLGQKEIWDSLSYCLDMLGGDTDFILEKYSDDVIILLSCYLLFIDPTLNEDVVFEFERKYNALINRGSSVKSEDDLDTPAASISYTISNLLFIVFGNTNDAHKFIQTCLGLFPMWINYHLGKLLLISKKLRNHRKVPELRNLDYYEFLLDEYLQYLLQVQINFGCFKYYYLHQFDFDKRMQLDYLKRIVCINLKDQRTLEAISSKNCQYIIEKAITSAVKVEFRSVLTLKDLLLFLNYAKGEGLCTQLLCIIFDIEESEKVTGDPEKTLEYCRIILADSRESLSALSFYSKICELKYSARSSTDFKLLFESTSYILQTLEDKNLVFYLEVFKVMDAIFEHFNSAVDYRFDDQIVEDINMIYQKALLRMHSIPAHERYRKHMNQVAPKILKLL
jgi:hypothetical protein